MPDSGDYAVHIPIFTLSTLKKAQINSKYIKKERALYQNARSNMALASHFDTKKSFRFTVGAAGCIGVQIALFGCIL